MRLRGCIVHLTRWPRLLYGERLLQGKVKIRVQRR